MTEFEKYLKERCGLSETQIKRVQMGIYLQLLPHVGGDYLSDLNSEIMELYQRIDDLLAKCEAAGIEVDYETIE